MAENRKQTDRLSKRLLGRFLDLQQSLPTCLYYCRSDWLLVCTSNFPYSPTTSHNHPNHPRPPPPTSHNPFSLLSEWDWVRCERSNRWRRTRGRFFEFHQYFAWNSKRLLGFSNPTKHAAPNSNFQVSEEVRTEKRLDILCQNTSRSTFFVTTMRLQEETSNTTQHFFCFPFFTFSFTS